MKLDPIVDPERPTGRFRATFLALSLGIVACGSPVVKKGPPVFFPAAPALPRIQFLASFSGSKDIEEQSAFNRFVVGEKQDLRLDKPYGIGIHDEKIYVCDSNSTVLVFDFRNRRFAPIEGAAGEGRLVQPLNVSIDAAGTKYVADPVRGQIVVFDRDDAYVRAYGKPGSWRPVDAVPFEDRLYVVDAGNRIVRVFDLASGEELETIGDKGEPTERLDRPTNLAFDRDGFLYVTDAGRFQVLKFDRDGHVKATIGRPGDNLGHFARPKGLAVDRDGLLFVADASFNNVQIFNKDGRLLMFFGEGGERPGNLLLPAKVALDYDNVSYFERFFEPGFQAEYLILVTSQFGPRMVNVFAYGKQKGKTYPTDEELLKQIEERRRKELERQQPQQPAESPAPEPEPPQ